MSTGAMRLTWVYDSEMMDLRMKRRPLRKEISLASEFRRLQTSQLWTHNKKVIVTSLTWDESLRLYHRAGDASSDGP